MVFLLLTLIVLSGLDVVTTMCGLARGGTELNLLARWLISKGNPWIVLSGMKVALIVLAFAMDSQMFYAVLIMLTAAAAGWNLWQLSGHIPPSVPPVAPPATQR